MILVPVTDAKTSERTARGNAIAENKTQTVDNETNQCPGQALTSSL